MPISHNTVLHRLVRALVKPLACWGITPNQITSVRLATGLVAAGGYALGSATGVYVGSALLLLSIGLDRLDGELARATNQMSEWGHKFDLLSDATVNGLVFLGVGIGLRDSALGSWAIVLGVVAASAVAAALTLVVRLESRHGTRAGEIRFVRSVDPDDAMVLAPIAMLLGAAPALLVTAAIAAPLAVATLVLHFRRQLAPAARE